MTLGLFFVRKRRRSIGAPPTEFRAWNVVLVFAILVNIYLLALPWVPPEDGINGGDVSFFYAAYCIVGLGMYVFSLFFFSFPSLTTFCLSIDSSSADSRMFCGYRFCRESMDMGYDR